MILNLNTPRKLIPTKTSFLQRGVTITNLMSCMTFEDSKRGNLFGCNPAISNYVRLETWHIGSLQRDGI